MNKEIWIGVLGYEELYEVSNFGMWKIKERIVSKGKRGQRFVPEKITSGFISGEEGNDYKKVCLSKNGSEKPISIHRLVAIHFIPNPDNKPYVNHKDGNRMNNSVENLEWVTSLENLSHCHKKMNYKSKFTGVTLIKKTNRWQARITINKKRISLGVFEKEEDAYLARNNYEKLNNIVNKYS
jgi:hypothetical protein